ncbi:hypothetical protein V8E36_006807 [Tilletia maclaganii]
MCLCSDLFSILFEIQNAAQDKYCSDAADFFCGGEEKYRTTEGWAILYYWCMSAYWRSIASSDKCPHPKVGCKCYRGCVADRWERDQDVGAECVEACSLASQSVQSCGGS